MPILDLQKLVISLILMAKFPAQPLQLPFSDPVPLPVNKNLLCELPDGTLLRWQFGKRRSAIKNFPYEKDDKSLRGAIKRGTKRLATARNKDDAKKAKHSFPKVFTMPQACEYKVLIADFDENLPKGISSHDELFSCLTHCFPDEAIARTSSGKVKIFFLIRAYYSNLHWFEARDKSKDVFSENRDITPKCGPHPLPPKINTEDYKDLIRQIFQRHDYFLSKVNAMTLFEAVDKKTPAFQVAFISDDIREKLKNVKNSPVHEFRYFYETPDSKLQTEPKKKTRSKFLRRYRGQLPEFFIPILKKGKTRDSHERFLRLVLDSKQLLYSDGFGMPITKIATTCRTSPTLVAGWRKDLEERGFLKCIDSRYSRGEKAQIFQATGLLQRFMLELHGEPTERERAWPKTFNDGEWFDDGKLALERVVSDCVWRRKSDEEIRKICEAWIEGLEGLDSKSDRRGRLLGYLDYLISERVPEWRK